MIFVYGTLMRGLGFPMHAELAARARFVSGAVVSGRLLAVDWYPGLVPACADDETVRGEIYEADDETALLAILDAYEGCGATDPAPQEYRRLRMTATTPDGTPRQVWAYLYQGPTTELPVIPNGDFRDWGHG